MGQKSWSIIHCCYWAVGNWQRMFFLFILYIRFTYCVPAEREAQFVLQKCSGAQFNLRPQATMLTSLSSVSHWNSWRDCDCLHAERYLMHKGSLWQCRFCRSSNFQTWTPSWGVWHPALSSIPWYAYRWLVVGSSSMYHLSVIIDWWWQQSIDNVGGFETWSNCDSIGCLHRLYSSNSLQKQLEDSIPNVPHHWKHTKRYPSKAITLHADPPCIPPNLLFEACHKWYQQALNG